MPLADTQSIDPVAARTSGSGLREDPRTMLAGAAGNTLEWYDFTVYGFFAAIFARNFFPDSDAFVGLMAAFGIFAASFLMRPLGAVMFGHIGDRIGRRRALYLSSALMTAATFAIGLLPTYAAAGALAPALLLVLRMLQGLSLGGEYTTSSIFLGESARAGRRGLVSSLASCGAGAGTLLGSATAAVTATLMSTDDLTAWGWRVPFLAGVLLGIFTLYLRRNAGAPAEVKAARTELPLVEAFRLEWPNMLRATALSAMLGAGVYMLFVYLTTYMEQVDRLAPRTALQINTISMIVLILLTPLYAALSDRIGRKQVMAAGLVGLVLFTWPLFRLIDGGDAQDVLLGQLGFALLLIAYTAPMPAALVEMFRGSSRCSSVAFSYNLALAIFGGTAPMIAVFLVDREQAHMGPAPYLIVVALISLAGVLSMKDRTGASLD